MPAVLVIEALAQLASILAWRTVELKPGGGEHLLRRASTTRASGGMVQSRRPAGSRSSAAAAGPRHRQVRRARDRGRRGRGRGRSDGGDAHTRRCGKGTLTCRGSTRRRRSTRERSSPPMSRSGAFSIVGPHVILGAGTVVGPHAVITGRTTIGARNRVFQFASIGEIPQDRKYGGEPTTTIIGDDNVVPRIRVDSRGNGAGPRIDDDRQRQPAPRLCARGA